MAGELSENQLNEIREQLQTGHKLNAVKMYRKWTGSSLVEAKKSVEKIAAGVDVGTSFGDELPGNEMDEILNAIQQGQKLQAVKLYKQSSGCSLKDSKDFIENLMKELEIADPGSFSTAGGCGSAVFFFIVVTAGVMLGM